MSLFLHDRVELTLEDEPLGPPSAGIDVAGDPGAGRPVRVRPIVSSRRSSPSAGGWLAVGLLIAVVVAIWLVVGGARLPGRGHAGCQPARHAVVLPTPVGPSGPHGGMPA